MEAALLAIAGGQPVSLIADNTGSSSKEDGSINNPIFRAMMQAAKQAQAGEAAANDGAAFTSQLITTVDLMAAAAGDIDLQIELPEGELKASKPGTALALLWNHAQAENSHALALAPLSASEQEVQYGLWQITDSVSGSQMLISQLPEEQLLVLSEDELQAMLALDADSIAPLQLPDEAKEALEQMLAKLRELHTNLDPEALSQEASVPLVTFTPLPLPQWLTSARSMNVEAIQIIDASEGQKLPIPSPLAAALNADDFSGLSDGDLADLDALVEQLSKPGATRDTALGDFRNKLAEQLVNQTSQEGSQPSVLSASHASQQTRPDEALQFKVLQANPALNAENSSPTDQVRVTVSQAMRAGLDRVVIQLEPAELGRVDIRMDVGADGRAQLVIQADNKDTLDMLQRDARALERALQEAGLDANAQDMEFNLGQGGADGENEASGTNDALTENYEEAVDELRQPELTLDPLTGSYTLSIAQGLNIKV